MHGRSHRSSSTITRKRRISTLLYSSPLLSPSRARAALNIDISDVSMLWVLWYFIVLAHRVGIFGNDVPGVQQAGHPAEHAEKDVDDGVGGANAGFDPDGDRREEDGD
jgi:hypothetical protein